MARISLRMRVDGLNYDARHPFIIAPRHSRLMDGGRVWLRHADVTLTSREGRAVKLQKCFLKSRDAVHFFDKSSVHCTTARCHCATCDAIFASLSHVTVALLH